MSREVIDDEEIKWVPIELYGCIIGRGGRTKTELEVKSGATIQIPRNNGPIQLRGTKKQRKEAKYLIHEKMNENDFSSTSDWNELTFVEPDQIGFIIGKGRKNIKYIMEKYNVEIKPQAGKLYIRGDIDEDNNKKAIEDIKDNIINSENKSSSNAWSELTFVKPDDIPHIGSIDMLYIMHNHNVEIEKHANKLYIRGDINEENNDTAVNEIKEILNKVKDLYIDSTDLEKENWTLIKDVPAKLFNQIRDSYKSRLRLEIRFNLNIKFFKEEKEISLALQGTEEDKIYFSGNLEKILLFNPFKSSIKFFFTGNVKTICISPCSKHRNLRKININNGTEDLLGIENNPSFREALLKSLKVIKETMDENTRCMFSMLTTRVFSCENVGQLNVNKINYKNFYSKQLDGEDFDPYNMERLVKESCPIIRYDVKISLPEARVIPIHFKLFLQEDKKTNDLKFLVRKEEVNIPDDEEHQHIENTWVNLKKNKAVQKITTVDPRNGKC